MYIARTSREEPRPQGNMHQSILSWRRLSSSCSCSFSISFSFWTSLSHSTKNSIELIFKCALPAEASIICRFYTWHMANVSEKCTSRRKRSHAYRGIPGKCEIPVLVFISAFPTTLSPLPHSTQWSVSPFWWLRLLRRTVNYFYAICQKASEPAPLARTNTTKHGQDSEELHLHNALPQGTTSGAAQKNWNSVHWKEIRLEIVMNNKEMETLGEWMCFESNISIELS